MDPLLAVTAVQAVGNAATPRRVAVDVGVEQVQTHAAHSGTPHASTHGSPASPTSMSSGRPLASVMSDSMSDGSLTG